MKNQISQSLGLLMSLLLIGNVEAQVLNRIKDKVKQTVEDRTVQEAGETTDKAINNTQNGKEEKQATNSSEDSSEEKETSQTNKSRNGQVTTIQSYSNYDFVAGDKIIYQYDMIGETDSEIPGRLLIDNGSAEIQTYNNEKVLFVPINGNVYMKPEMKDNSYLPQQFTMEFDLLTNGISNTDCSEITLYFRTKEQAGNGSAVAPIRIDLTCISGDEGQPHYNFSMEKIGADGNSRTIGGNQPFPPAAINSDQNNWRHIAIYVNKNIGKLYVDQHRVAVVNQIDVGTPQMVEIEVRNQINPVMFKNFRIAAGGSDAYNKVITDGKFIAYGILFDVNKATLRPESMGTINEIAKMMKVHPELKFEIGGHTDSDGNAAANNKLSQERADAVQKQLVSMGIDASRLITKGYGSSKPIADNNNAENKARNRRVEFVKK